MLKVLVAVDGSAPSDKAVAHAIRLAGEVAAISFLVVNVQPEPEFRSLALHREEMLEELREAGETVLAGARASFAEAGVTITERREIGDPAEVIAEIITAEEIDLVVMGTMGLGSIAGLVFGSVAMRVIHLVDVPLTLVK